jgi:hypothetical protein
MTFGATAERDTIATPLGYAVLYLVGVAGLAFSITLLWFGMRATLDIGGFCASGGPYEIAVECPDAVVAAMPLSILGGFAAVGLMLWGGARLGGGWMALVFLAWPALFLSLGWNFLEYGFLPPDGGWVWSWVICGVLFVLMGGLPLVAAIGSVRSADHGGREYASGRVVVRPKPSGASVVVVPQVGPPPSEPRSALPDEPLVDRLERLVEMRRRGDLTAAEYETAKAATLAEVASDR